jgi:hypothetical protein
VAAESALVLTDEEWHDLRFMVAAYKGDRVGKAFSPGIQAVVNRRVALADRIIDAAANW